MSRSGTSTQVEAVAWGSGANTDWDVGKEYRPGKAAPKDPLLTLLP